MGRSLPMPGLLLPVRTRTSTLTTTVPFFLSEAQEAAGLHGPGTPVSGPRAARSAFREPQSARRQEEVRSGASAQNHIVRLGICSHTRRGLASGPRSA